MTWKKIESEPPNPDEHKTILIAYKSGFVAERPVWAATINEWAVYWMPLPPPPPVESDLSGEEELLP